MGQILHPLRLNNIREDMAAFRDQYMENKHSSNSIESDWYSVKNAISESMDRNIPKKTVKSKADTPWMTNRNILNHRNKTVSVW